MTLASSFDTEGVPPAPPLQCPVAPGGAFNPFVVPNFADVHPQLAWARTEAPVHYSEGLHMWIVSRYADAVQILRDPETFSSSTRPVILSQFVEEAQDILATTDTFAAPNMGFDGKPDHDRLRRPVSAYFSAKGVAALEPRIRELARRHLDQIPDSGTVDLNAHYAKPLASTVILDVVGLPPVDYGRIMRYHDAVAAFFFGNPPPDEQVRYACEVEAWEQYLTQFVARRRHQPADDLTTYLLAKIDRGDAQYSESELIGFLSFDVVTAGIRPTSFALINLVRQLLEQRRYWNLLREDPSQFDRAFDESLRRSALSLGVFRQATTDVEVNGVTIPAGAVVWVMICSTSRDEDQFPDAATFDPHRPNLSSSLHFSHGLHYCLGSALARATTRIGLELLTERYPGLQLTPTQPVEYEPSINLMVPTQLLVEL